MGLGDFLSDTFEFIFDDVLGIIDFPSAPTPPAQEELETLEPEEVSEIALEELQAERRKASRRGGFFGSILTGGGTDSSLMN